MNETKHPAGHVLQAYNDGELDPSAAGEVADHCEHCEVCRSELAELEGMGRLLAGIPAPELPQSVWHSVRPRREREFRLRPALAVAACAAGIIIGVLLGPVRFSAEEAAVETAWSETVTVWSGDVSSSLLGVYQTEQE
jgi:anti-sigma factor RsiW